MATGSLPIIDAHHHLWDLDNHRYPWLDPGTPSIVGDTSAIRKSYVAADFLRDSAGLEIIASIHLDGGFDPADPVGETRLAHRMFEASGFPNAIVGAVDLASAEAPRLIDAHLAASPLFRGVRQIVAWHDNPRLSYVADPEMMNDGGWRNGFAYLSRMGLSFDLQIYPSQMTDAARLASDFPDTPIILNQAGMPDWLISGDAKAWRDGLRALAERPNVTAKISGLGMLKPGWTQADVKTTVDGIVEAFGPDRVMFGSNFPVDRLFRSYRDIFDSYVAAIADYTPDERRAMLSGTALRVYRPQNPHPLHHPETLA